MGERQQAAARRTGRGAPHERRHLARPQEAAHILQQRNLLLLVLGVEHGVGQVLRIRRGHGVGASAGGRQPAAVAAAQAAAVAGGGKRRGAVCARRRPLRCPSTAPCGTTHLKSHGHSCRQDSGVGQRPGPAHLTAWGLHIVFDAFILGLDVSHGVGLWLAQWQAGGVAAGGGQEGTGGRCKEAAYIM